MKGGLERGAKFLGGGNAAQHTFGVKYKEAGGQMISRTKKEEERR